MADPCGSAAHTNCEEALHELYGFLDGELTAQRRTLIESHIDECSPCLEAFDFENDLRALIAKKCHDVAPESLRQRIADAIAQCDDGPE